MAVTDYQFQVTSTATLLATIPAGPSSATLVNNGASAMYIGSGSAVTTSNGYEVASGGSWSYSGQLTSGPYSVWAVASSGTVTASISISTPR